MVRLVHRRDPTNVRLIDQRVYAFDMGRWRDFRQDAFLRQDADKSEVERALEEYDINRKRLAERDAKKDWEFTSKQSEHNVVTEPDAVDISVTVARKADVEGKPTEPLIPAPKRRGRPPKAKA